jgi:N-acetylmuramoyl-L-alanine amidase
MITVGDPTAVNETATEALFRVPLSTVGTTSPSAQYLNPNTIQVTIPNAEVPINREGQLGTGAYVTRSAISNDGRGNVVWLLTTSRAFAFRIGVNARNLDVRLIRPQGSNGTLTGKVIIVDAGHGGHDPGARAGGVNEKDLAMRIARFVATDLTTAGASIIMTREDDRFIELAERPAIANRSEADLFISVHINSNAVANSRSGSIMFYHMDSAMGGLLAALIDDELKQVSGLPSMGTRSDRTIYSTGFAVLRLSRMPAVPRTVSTRRRRRRDPRRAALLCPMSQRKRTNPAAVIGLIAISALSFGGLTYYVMNRPQPNHDTAMANPAPTPATQDRDTTAPPIERDQVQTHDPSYAGGNFSTRTSPSQVPQGTDAAVFAVNDYLDKLPNIPKAVDVKSIAVRDKIATVDFSPQMRDVSFGSEDEQIFVVGILKVLGQFPEIRDVAFTIDGQKVESFGHLDLSTPQPVERSRGS